MHEQYHSHIQKNIRPEVCFDVRTDVLFFYFAILSHPAKLTDKNASTAAR